MSYHIYTTDAIVLKRTVFGESNALFHILTKDLGLIIASAQAVRSIHSKLSSALQEYGLVSLSCVKGKNGWKITNAMAKENFFFKYPAYAQKLISQISALLIRMMPGEDANPEIFSVVCSGFSYMGDVTEKEIPQFECLLMLRMLYCLGYVSSDADTEKFLVPMLEWNKGALISVGLVKPKLVERINKGLKESQL